MSVEDAMTKANAIMTEPAKRAKLSRKRGLRALELFAVGNTIKEVVEITGMSESWASKFRSKYSQIIDERRKEITASLSLKGLKPLKSANAIVMKAMERQNPDTGELQIDSHALRAAEMVYDRVEPVVKNVEVNHTLTISPVDLSKYQRQAVEGSKVEVEVVKELTEG